MFDIFNISIILGIFRDYSPIAGWVIIVWLLWKIATNHLRHISTDIKKIGLDVNSVQAELKENTKTTNELGQRVAKIEGKLSATICKKVRQS